MPCEKLPACLAWGRTWCRPSATGSQAARLVWLLPGGATPRPRSPASHSAKTAAPHLEDDATIWLVHWLLASNPPGATAVYWFFNHFHKPAFATDEVAASLAGFVDREAAARTSSATLDRDAAMLLRMYARTAAGNRLTLEDVLDSPLSLLDLVDRVDARRRRSAPSPRADLPLPVFAFAVAEVFRHLDTPHVANPLLSRRCICPR